MFCLVEMLDCSYRHLLYIVSCCFALQTPVLSPTLSYTEMKMSCVAFITVHLYYRLQSVLDKHLANK